MPEAEDARAPRARTILHVDMDAFFAAVEEREDPSLHGRPVVIGADPRGGEGRGVVSTANYEARKYGIHSAQPISQAWRRCPHAVFLPPRGRLYSEVSRQVFDVFASYTDQVEPLGIDEAFLDVTASRRLFGEGPELARRLKNDVRDATALTASVGVAAAKFVAKIASDLRKPDGLVVVEPGTEAEFLAPLPVRRLWGAGPMTLAKLRALGCATIGDVAALDPDVLVRRFGDALGGRFHRLANGIDARRVHTDRGQKSLGKETTFGVDQTDRSAVERTLLGLCEGVAAACRRKGISGTTVTVKLRFSGFDTVTRQSGVPLPADTVEAIWPVARGLFRKADRRGAAIRLVGVTLSGFDGDPATQLGMFEPTGPPADRVVAEAVDRLRERFGRDSVRRAALLETDDE
jgi:nucleotidyltransferase/DNA polymerase involved in DNA repair